MNRISAWRAPWRRLFISGLLFGVLLLWGYRHVSQAIAYGSIGEYLYAHWFYIFSFAMLATTLLISHFERPDIHETLREEHVTIVVPAYNEDGDALHACLDSLLHQSRLPEEIYVIDDGSNKSDYRGVHDWFIENSAEKQVRAVWHRKENGGKRHAQAVAFQDTPYADIYVTVDSDSILDPFALEELLRPFRRADVQSVAGVVLAKNNRTNFLARVTDLLFVTGQLIDRSTMSTLGTVLVNSGGLAAYRAEVVRDNLEAYLHEEFFGHRIEFSDDSMLTLYALERGKTVQQPSAYVFTMMPDRFSHHYRQQLRWMKGSFIRSWWRIRYLPVNSFGFIRQVMGWGQFVMTTLLLVLLLLFGYQSNVQLFPYIIFVPLVVAYTQSLRYLTITRTDERLSSQLLTYTLAPLAMIWSYAFLRPVRIFAMFQVFKNEWGTRGDIEVSLLSRKRKVPIAQRMQQYCELIVARQTLYEYARAEVLRDNSAIDVQLTKWYKNYQHLSDAQKWEMWSSFQLFVTRIRTKRYPLLVLKYHQ